MSTTLSFSGNVYNADSSTRYELLRIAPSLSVDSMVQYGRMSIATGVDHTVDLSEIKDLGNGPEARAIFLFVHSGSVIVDLSTGPAGGDIAHVYVDKMFILLDGRALSATVTGVDASGSVYDLIIGG